MKNAEATATDTTATVAVQGATVAPEKAPSKKGTSQKEGTTKGQHAAKGAKTKPAAKKRGKAKKPSKPTRTKAASTLRAESKSAKILALIGRPKGATLAEIMKTTDWQAHSVRGFISTTAKKYKLNIESAKNEAGERTYKIAK
jgi:hypothetical protein